MLYSACIYIYIILYYILCVCVCIRMLYIYTLIQVYILYMHGKETKNIVISEEDRSEFWKHYGTHRGGHPACANGRHNPVGVAGDDARYNLAGYKVVVMLLSLPLQTIRSLEMCRYPYFVLRESLSLGARTLDPVFRVVCWSLNVAFNGFFPSRGPFPGEELDEKRRRMQGQPLSGGPYAIAEIRGDWKWHRECFLLRRHYSSTQVCCFCEASRKRSPFSHLGSFNF